MGISLSTPFPAWAWPLVWEWMQGFRNRVTDDFSPRTADEFVRFSLARSDEERTWGVWRDDELGGLISYRSTNPISGTTHCLFKRAFWGRDTTVPALRQAYAQLFAEGVLSLVSFVYEDNYAIRDLARQLGAVELRPLRAFTVRDGALVDGVVIQLLKESFDAAMVSSSPDWRCLLDRGRPVESGQDVHPDVSADLHRATDGDPEPAGQHALGAPGESQPAARPVEVGRV